MKISGIYILLNTVNFKVYVGKSKNIAVRLSEHINHLRKNKHENSYLQFAWNRYGERAFIYKIIEECNLQDLGIKEIYWVNCLKSIKREFGYNLEMPTADGGKTVSDFTRKKISNIKKLAIGDKNPFFGKQHTEEAKMKMSIAARKRVGHLNSFFGKSHNTSTKEKISKSNIGKKRSEETKRQMSKDRSGEKNPMFGVHLFGKKSGFYGKHLSEESKQKIGMKNGKLFKLVNPENEVIEIFNLRKFCKDNNLNYGSMYRISTGKQNQYKGWTKHK